MAKHASVLTRVLPADATGAVETAVALLASGQPVAFPTDTVYGVGAHALLPEAVSGLYRLKQRPSGLAIPLLMAGPETIHLVCVDVPPLAWDLARRYWPGALSLVLRRSALVPDIVTAGGPTVAVRVPDHPLVREICRRLGAPLAATSANRHGRPDAVAASGVWSELAGRIPLILDGGACAGGVPSTVLDLTTEPPVVLRTGPVVVQSTPGGEILLREDRLDLPPVSPTD